MSKNLVQVRSVFFLCCHTDENFGKISKVIDRELCKRWALFGHTISANFTALT